MRTVLLTASLNIASALFQLITEPVQILGRVECRLFEVV